MATKQETIEQLLRTAQDLKNSVTTEEFIKAFKAVIESFNTLKANIFEQLDTAKKEMQQGLQDVKKAKTEDVDKIEKRITTALQKMEKQLSNELNFIHDKVADIADGIDGTNADEDAMIERLKKLIPEIPEFPASSKETNEEVRNKLEALSDDERLDVSAIKGLKNLVKKLGARTVFVGTGGTGRAIKALDLNDYGPLDGSRKTFNIPAVWRVNQVHFSSAPWIAKPQIDFTWTPTSITFTDEINAETTLKKGQTVVLEIVEA